MGCKGLLGLLCIQQGGLSNTSERIEKVTEKTYSNWSRVAEIDSKLTRKGKPLTNEKWAKLIENIVNLVHF